MPFLQQLNQRETLKFLESREVQEALVESFCQLYTKAERKEIAAKGFWKFAGENADQPQPGKQERGKFTSEMRLLYDLYLARKGRHPMGNPARGSLGGTTEYKPKSEFNVATTRRHIRNKFRRHQSPLARVDINVLEEGFHQPHIILVVYPSREAASGAHQKKGRPAKRRVDYPPDALGRKVQNLRTGLGCVLPRPEIEKVVEDFLRQDKDTIQVLCGSCGSGKTTWMLGFHGAHEQESFFYPFDRRLEELSSQRALTRHLSERCKRWASLADGALDTLVALEELWANLGTLQPWLKVKPVVLLDGLEQAGPCLDPMLEFVRRSVTQASGLFRFVLTMRTPTNLLPRLQNLPQVRVSRVLDSEAAVLEFMQSWCRAVAPNRPVPDERLRSIYEQTGSNLGLATAELTPLLGGNHDE